MTFFDKIYYQFNQNRHSIEHQEFMIDPTANCLRQGKLKSWGKFKILFKPILNALNNTFLFKLKYQILTNLNEFIFIYF